MMPPAYLELEGRRVHLPTLAVHSTLIFASTFLMTLVGAGIGNAITGAPQDARADAMGALVTATFGALLKVIFYLAARTGAPLDVNASPPQKD